MKNTKQKKYDFFKTYFKLTIRNIKKGYMYNAKLNLERIRGANAYLLFIGEISDETHTKIYNLTTIIETKYYLYLY